MYIQFPLVAIGNFEKIALPGTDVENKNGEGA